MGCSEKLTPSRSEASLLRSLNAPAAGCEFKLLFITCARRARTRARQQRLKHRGELVSSRLSLLLLLSLGR